MKKNFIIFGAIFLVVLGILILKINAKENKAGNKTDKLNGKEVYGFVISNKTQEASKTGIGCNIEVKVGDHESFVLTPDQKDASAGSFKFVETKDQKPVKITWIEKYVLEPNKKAVMCENGFQHIIKEFKPRLISKKQIDAINALNISLEDNASVEKNKAPEKNKNKNTIDLDLLIFNDGGYLDKRDNNKNEQISDIKPIVEQKDFQGYFNVPNLNDIPKEKLDKALQFAIITLRDQARQAHLSVVEKIIFDYMVEKFFTGNSWVEKAKVNPKG